MSKITFNNEILKEFTQTLRGKVHDYFKERQLSTRANKWMYAKSLFFLLIVISLYSLMLSGWAQGIWFFVVYLFLGFMSGCAAMNIAHDALHGAYFKNKYNNRLVGFVMDILGGSSFYWKYGHTVQHHLFTNVDGQDVDINASFLLRLCPHQKRYVFHRFQHIYAPLLYSVNLIRWIYFSDYKRVVLAFRDRQEQPKFSWAEILALLGFKLLHIVLFLGLPLLLLPFPWWQVVLGYLGFLAVLGFTMTLVFQLAHIVEEVDYPMPDGTGHIEDNFIHHQLITTTNFANRSRWICFLFGGLNFQVEHHIFPQICHIHLAKISRIVRETAREFQMPYHENRTFLSAVWSHFGMLRKLGMRVS